MDTEDINTHLTRIIGNTESDTNAVRRVTPHQILRSKRINPRRIVTKPAVPVRMMLTMPDVPVYLESKVLLKNEKGYQENQE